MITAKKLSYHAPAFAQAMPLHTLRNIPFRTRTKQRSPTWRSQLHSSSQRVTEPTTFRLAPSDFAFLWEECQRCFYLKVHRKMYRPRAPFPSIFSNIDMAMKRHFKGLRTQDVLPEMPPGTFLCDEEDAWVECEPIRPPGRRHSVYIRGMVDGLVQFDDKSYGVIDFKTSSAAKTGSMYARQLHAYAHAIEKPAKNSELVGGKVSDMGLVVYTPDQFHTPIDENDKLSAALTGQLTYVPVKRDDDEFFRYLGDIVDVLSLPEAPPPPKPVTSRANVHTTCPYCQYLCYAKQHNMTPA